MDYIFILFRVCYTQFIFLFFYSGVEVKTPTGKIQVHCMVLMCSADLPAKAKVGNCVQYNGYNGCNTCDIYGTLVGRTVYWPYDPKATLRKHHEVLQYAEEATMTGKPVCILMLMSNFSMRASIHYACI